MARQPPTGRNTITEEAPEKSGAFSALRPTDAETALRQAIQSQLGEGAKRFTSSLSGTALKSVAEKIRTGTEFSDDDRTALNNAAGKTWPGSKTDWGDGLHPSAEGIVEKTKATLKEQAAAISVLRHTTTLAVPDESPDHDEWIQILLQTTGVIHGQILSDGIGVTVGLTHAPTSEQIRAIRDLQLIRGDNFAAQVLLRVKPVADVGRFDQMVSAILSPRS